jgi:hypothetical protein
VNHHHNRPLWAKRDAYAGFAGGSVAGMTIASSTLRVRR